MRRWRRYRRRRARGRGLYQGPQRRPVRPNIDEDQWRREQLTKDPEGVRRFIEATERKKAQEIYPSFNRARNYFLPEYIPGVTDIYKGFSEAWFGRGR